MNLALAYISFAGTRQPVNCVRVVHTFDAAL